MTTDGQRRAVRRIFAVAVRSGFTVVQSVCNRCGGSGVMHGHHADYTKPLDVEWLCPSCHKKEHINGPWPPRRKPKPRPKPAPMARRSLNRLSTLGDRLREQRTQRDLTLREVGGIAGCGFSTICRLENGVGCVRLDKFLAICDALGIKPATALRE